MKLPACLNPANRAKLAFDDGWERTFGGKQEEQSTPNPGAALKTTDLKLGDLAKDTISGLVGVVTGEFKYLNGCVRMALTPRELKDGKPVEGSVFDVEQLELVETQVMKQRALAGGPMPTPARQASPP